ncbi:hypothetical protein L1887_51761 [Cichorium endivia]|nr:hypothetical protein L1887_51761 [Cichorium endivia]
MVMQKRSAWMEDVRAYRATSKKIAVQHGLGLGEDATPCEALVLQRGAQPDRRSELARHHTVRRYRHGQHHLAGGRATLNGQRTDHNVGSSGSVRRMRRARPSARNAARRCRRVGSPSRLAMGSDAHLPAWR